MAWHICQYLKEYHIYQAKRSGQDRFKHEGKAIQALNGSTDDHAGDKKFTRILGGCHRWAKNMVAAMVAAENANKSSFKEIHH